jgi:hypothetical protein
MLLFYIVLYSCVLSSYGNTTVTIPENTLKFTVSISGWQFANSNNTLTFGATLVVTGTGATTPTVVSSSSNNKVYFGSSSIDLPTTAVIDGNSKSITATASADGSSIQWVFPSFTHTLVYDPTIGMANSSSTNVASFMLAIVFMIAAMFSSKQF